jgi:poly(3-hydroxybutyrate) depolymerase
MMRYVMTLVLLGTVLALLAGCSPAASVAPPEVVDTWQPPEGVEATPPLSCDEIGGLFAYDAAAPLDIREEKRWRDGGVTVTDFNYASPRGGRVPATLVVPDGAGPFAGLVFMHGHGGYRRNLLARAETYARLGAVGILISAPSNRPEHDNYLPIFFRGEPDSREQIQLIVDLRRAVDILLAQPEVDPQRVGYVGSSYGGAMGGLLAGVEGRIKAYALEVGDGGLVTHFSGAMIMGLPDQVRRDWLAAMWPIEPIHYVGCAAPAALLFQNSTLDEMVAPADALRYQRAGSEPKTIRWYAAGHALNGQAYRDQAEWLRKAIGIASRRAAFPLGVRVVLIAWFLLTAGSLAFVALILWRTCAPRGARLLWLLATAFLGPLGLVIYWISSRQTRDAGESGEPASPGRRALGSAAWAASGNVCGVVVFLGLLLCLQGDSGSSPVLPLAAMVLLPFCTGWLIFAAARRLSRPDASFSTAYRRPVLTEVVSTGLVIAGAYPPMTALIRFFIEWTVAIGFDLTYAPLWGGLSLACLAGTLVTYPFHLWMIRRGVIRWGG